MLTTIELLINRIRGGRYRLAAIQSVATGFAGQVILIGSGVFSARILGPENRGIMAIILIYPAVISLVGSFGFPQAVTYFLSIQPQNAKLLSKKTLKVYYYQAICLSILFAFLILPYTNHKSFHVQIAAFSAIIGVPGMLAEQYGLALLQGKNLFRPFNLSRLLQPTIYTILVGMMYFQKSGNLLRVTFAWSISTGLAGFVILTFAYKTLMKDGANPVHQLPSIKEMFMFGSKGLIGSISPVESFRIDQIIAGLYLSPIALGFYVIGKAFSNLPRFVAQSAGMVIFPAVASQRESPNVKFLIWKFLGAAGLFNLIITLLLIFLMPTLIPLFFGKDFLSAIPVAQILLCGAFFISLRMMLGESMRGLGHPQVSTIAEFTMYLCLAFSVPILLHYYNLNGLAAGLTAGYVFSFLVVTILSLRIFKKTERIP